jgi:hypothetical protein
MVAKDSSIPQPGALPPGAEDLDFIDLVLMLGTTANMELGEKGPKGAQKEADLPRARKLINMLMAIKRKTEERRTPQEDEVLRKVVSDLQAKYVKAAGLNNMQRVVNNWAAGQYQRNQRPS